MRCKSCEKTHNHSNKGKTWKEFQLCKSCFKIYNFEKENNNHG